LAGGWVSVNTTSPGFSTPVDRISLTWDCQTRHSPGTLAPIAKKIMNNYNYTSRLKRFLNWIIDGLVVLILWISLFLLFGSIMAQYELFDRIEQDITIDLGIAILPIYLLYYLILEGIFKTTVGKLITNTKLTNINGDRVNLGNVLIRTICRVIPFEPLSYLSENPVGLHDTFSNTRVLNKNDK
jgi:uncharacterized RDD family membrane protein YckC